MFYFLSTAQPQAPGPPSRAGVDPALPLDEPVQWLGIPLGKFSLDERFDVVQDTGTVVIDDYESKMPFKFTGTLEKVEIELGPDQLTPQQRGELARRGISLS
jgi:hypothetical protein